MKCWSFWWNLRRLIRKKILWKSIAMRVLRFTEDVGVSFKRRGPGWPNPESHKESLFEWEDWSHPGRAVIDLIRAKNRDQSSKSLISNWEDGYIEKWLTSSSADRGPNPDWGPLLIFQKRRSNPLLLEGGKRLRGNDWSDGEMDCLFWRGKVFRIFSSFLSTLAMNRLFYAAEPPAPDAGHKITPYDSNPPSATGRQTHIRNLLPFARHCNCDMRALHVRGPRAYSTAALIM